LRRNAATRSGGLEYRATTAQWHAERAAHRPKQGKLAINMALRTYVEERLAGIVVAPSGALVPGPAVSWKGRRHGRRKDRRWANAWSPEQIARRLPVDFPDDDTMRISHEAIYQALFVQGRGALRRELTACLRTGRPLRTPRARTRRRGKAFISPELMISQRPAEAADRAVPGHWEGELILGLGSSAIGTLVERMTQFTIFAAPTRAREAGAPAGRAASAAAAPSRATGSSRLGGGSGCWSTSPFLFSGIVVRRFWFGATMELGRSGRSMMMMSAGAGAARATGSSTTDRKICSTDSGGRDKAENESSGKRPTHI
jgi:hypothetical protein